MKIELDNEDIRGIVSEYIKKQFGGDWEIMVPYLSRNIEAVKQVKPLMVIDNQPKAEADPEAESAIF